MEARKKQECREVHSEDTEEYARGAEQTIARQQRTAKQVAHHRNHLKHLRIRLMQTHASFDAAKNERTISTAP